MFMVTTHQSESNTRRTVNGWTTLQEVENVSSCHLGLGVVGGKCHCLPHHHRAQNKGLSYPVVISGDG